MYSDRPMLDFLLLGLWTVSSKGGVLAFHDGPVSTKWRSASPTPSPPPRAEMVPPLSVEEVDPNLKCDPPPLGVEGIASDDTGSPDGTCDELVAGGPVKMKSSAPETTKVENLRGGAGERKGSVARKEGQPHQL